MKTVAAMLPTYRSIPIGRILRLVGKVAGSSPACYTKWIVRLIGEDIKIFDSCDMGSSPVQITEVRWCNG